MCTCALQWGAVYNDTTHTVWTWDKRFYTDQKYALKVRLHMGHVTWLCLPVHRTNLIAWVHSVLLAIHSTRLLVHLVLFQRLRWSLQAAPCMSPPAA